MAAFPVINRKHHRGLLAKALDITDKSEAPFKLSGRYDNVDPVPAIRCDTESKQSPSIYVANGRASDAGYSSANEDRSCSRTVSQESVSPRFALSDDKTPCQRAEHDRVFVCNDESRYKFYSSTHPTMEGMTRRTSIDGPSLQCIQEDDTSPVTSPRALNSTQQLRSGFFRTIKRQYPLLESMGMSDNSADSGHGDSLLSDDGSPSLDLQEELKDTVNQEHTSEESETTFMSSMARRRLTELRKVDPRKIDVATGLQWIRLELHEMREQDKALFLQLIKLHSTIKELRSDMNCVGDETDCSYDDISDAASLWWPRYSSATLQPSFSSSDGARFVGQRRHPELRRGFSLNYPRPRRLDSYFSAISSTLSERTSCRSSTSSVRNTTAC